VTRETEREIYGERGFADAAFGGGNEDGAFDVGDGAFGGEGAAARGEGGGRGRRAREVLDMGRGISC
jgi:hypothetical protein